VARYKLPGQEHHKVVIVFFSGVVKNTSFSCLCQGVTFGCFPTSGCLPNGTEEVIFNSEQDYLIRSRACQGVLARIQCYTLI